MVTATWITPDDPTPAGKRVQVSYPTHMTEPDWGGWLIDQLACTLEYAYETPVTTMTIQVAPHPDDHMHRPRGKYKLVTAINTSEEKP